MDKKQASYTMELISPNEAKEILDFLRPNFFSVEPLNKCIHLVESEEDCRALEEFCKHSINSGVSVKAVDDKGKTIGVMLNYIVEKSARKEEDHSNDGSNFSKITNLLGELNRRMDVFVAYPKLDRIFCNDLAAIATEWQSCGMAGKLLTYSKDLALKHNCSLITAQCTNSYSERVLDRMGYRSIYHINYKDYKVNGKVVFNMEAPHTKISLYVYEFKN